MSPRTGRPGRAPATLLTSARAAPAETLAFVESPVQLLNVLEWAHRGARSRPGTRDEGVRDEGARDVDARDEGVRGGAEGTAAGARGADDGTGAAAVVAGASGTVPAPGGPADGAGDVPVPVSVPARVPGARGGRTGSAAGGAGGAGRPADTTECDAPSGAVPGGSPSAGAVTGAAAPHGGAVTIVVLSPTDPMTRGQLRRMTELARDEGHQVRWEEARGAATAPLSTVRGLAPLLRAARRIVIGDPFSRYVQLLLTITRARDLVVVDDGTATMEFIAQLARGERLVRWHRRGGRRGPRELVFAPVSATARRRLTPGRRRSVEVFSSMPIDDAPDGVRITRNDFGWTRARFGPPRVADGADLVGTSLVETGVVDLERYLAAVRDLARAHGATRYFAHRREHPDKLHRLATESGLEIVRPDLPLELIARRGPIGSTVLSFPSTVVHTLPLALTGTGVQVAVCDIDPAWLTAHASPRAEGFLADVTSTARDAHRVGPAPADPAVGRPDVPGQSGASPGQSGAVPGQPGAGGRPVVGRAPSA